MSSIKKNFAYNSAYQILNLVIPLATTPYISRILGASLLGEYSYYRSIASYFSLFIILGLNNYGNRCIAKVQDNRATRSKIFWEIYFMQLIAALVVIMCYILFCVCAKQSVLAYIFIIYVISSGIDINWAFYGLELFKTTVVRSTVIKVVLTAATFLFVKKAEDVWVYAFLYVLSSLLAQMILWTKLPKHMDFYRPSWQGIRKHIKPNLILFIPTIAVSIYKLMDKIMLGQMTSMVEVGYYENAEKLLQIPNALVVSIGTVMLPKMSYLTSHNDQSRSDTYLCRGVTCAILLSAPMSFGIMAVAEELVPIFFGQGYDKCVYLLYALMPSCIFVAYANIVRTGYLIPRNKDKIYITSVCLGAVVNGVVNLLLIPKLLSMGAAIGTLLAEMVVCIYQLVKTRMEIPLFSMLKYSLPFLIAGIIMFELVYPINLFGENLPLNLVVKVVSGVAAFAVCVLILEGGSRILNRFRKDKQW